MRCIICSKELEDGEVELCHICEEFISLRYPDPKDQKRILKWYRNRDQERILEWRKDKRRKAKGVKK